MQADPTFTVVPPEDRLTVVGVFQNADIVMQFLMAGLAIAAVIAILVWVAQASRLGRRRSAGFESAMAYLMALSAAGPMIGFFGSAYTLFAGSLGMANVRPVPTMSVLAPGFAEALLAAMLGLLAASIAVIGRQHLKAKLYAVEMEARATAAEPTPLLHARAAA